MRTGVFDWSKFWDLGPKLLQDIPGAVVTRIIDDYNLVRHSTEAKFQMQVLDRRHNAFFLVPSGNDN
jgi:hypothetical protein